MWISVGGLPTQPTESKNMLQIQALFAFYFSMVNLKTRKHIKGTPHSKVNVKARICVQD